MLIEGIESRHVRLGLALERVDGVQHGAPPGQAEVVSAEPRKNDAPPPEAAATQVTATRPATAPPEAPRPSERTGEKTGELSDPAPGSYLQVAAPKRTAADGVVESLKNKGIAAVLAPGPNEETVRVLVGPLDSATIGRIRMDLEGAGFKPFPKKY